MTLAPPPATIVQMRPFGFKTVNFREALVFSSSSWIKLSVGLSTLPNGRENSMFPHFLKFLKAAVSSNSPLMSRGYGSPFTKVNGFISRNEKSKSWKTANTPLMKSPIFPRASNGRVAIKGAHASGVIGFSVGRKIVLTLSQFSSISIPPHSEKQMVLPNLSDTIER
uniref:Uncharacterized protein n=1 Tax=Arundo donax TaxID=35708 RepID=A0A0A9CVM3_ARUDO